MSYTFVVEPSWLSYPKYGEEFKTAITLSEDGHETRAGLYPAPRRRIQYGWGTGNNQIREYIYRKLYAWLREQLWVPMWPDYMSLGSAVGIGDVLINVADYQYRGLPIHSGRVMLFTDHNTWDDRSYSDISSGASGYDITLTVGTSNDYGTTDSIVVPMVLCRIHDMPSIQQLSGFASRGSLSFVEELQGSTNVHIPGITNPMLEDRPIFNVQPDWSSAGAWAIDRKVQRVSPGYGKEEVIIEGTYPYSSLGYSYILADISSIWDVRGFFRNRFGRVKGFWVPDWSRCLRLYDDVTAGQNTMTIYTVEHQSIYMPSASAYRRLYMWDEELGSFETLQVTGSVSGVSTDTLVLSAPFANSHDKDDVRIHCLYYVRFASDSLNLSYIDRGEAGCRLSYLELPHEYPFNS